MEHLVVVYSIQVVRLVVDKDKDYIVEVDLGILLVAVAIVLNSDRKLVVVDSENIQDFVAVVNMDCWDRKVENRQVVEL
jgi:hypothetical protein